MAGRACVPSSDTRPPLVTAARPACRAASAPHISSTTSTPSPPVAARSRATTSSWASIATSAPIAVGHRQPLRVEVGGEDGARAGHARDRHGHQPDRAAAEHGHRLAGDLLHEGGVDGVAHRLLDGRDLRREARPTPRRSSPAGRRTRRRRPAPARPGSAGAGRRGRGRCGTGSTSSRRGGSRPPPASPSGTRVGARAVGHDAGRPSRGRRSWAGCDVGLRPRVPAIDVQVGAAHAGRVDLDQQLARPGLGDRDVADQPPRAPRAP